MREREAFPSVGNTLRGGLYNNSLKLGMTVVILGSVFAEAQQEPPPVPFPKVEQEELFLQAIEALDTGKTDTMVQLLDRAVPLDPNNPFAYVKRGQLFDLIGNNSRAVEDFSKALAYRPAFADVYQMRGCNQFKLGNVNAAVQDWQAFLQLKPDKEAEHWQICVGFALLGHYEEARKRFDWHSTTNTQDLEVAFWHFLCVARTEGLEVARERIKSAPEEKRVPMTELHALFAGKGTEADVWLAVERGTPEKAERAKREFFAHYYLGLLRQSEGKLDEAKQSVKEALSIAKANDGFIGDSPGGQLRGGDIARVHLQQIDQQLTEQAAWENRGPGGVATGLAYLATGAGIILLIGYALRQQRRRDTSLELAEKSST